jgi:hypothetical protein
MNNLVVSAALAENKTGASYIDLPMLRSYSLDAQPTPHSQQRQQITRLHLSANFLMALC